LDDQNLNAPRIDSAGKRWHFRVWHDAWTEADRTQYAQRIFYWDDRRQICGVVLRRPGSALHVSKLRDLIRKLVADPSLREKHRCELKFPLERHYADYGALSEERSG
jgi:hypothetical protein